MPPEAARTLAERMKAEHGLVALAPYVALNLLNRAFEAGPAPEGWALLEELVDAGTRNSARLLDPLRGLDGTLDPAKVLSADHLVHVRNGVPMILPEGVADPAFDAVFAALTGGGDEVARKERIAGLIDQTADAALTGPLRAAWILAMDALSLLARDQGWAEVEAAARHNALALQAGWPGHRIPWARIWTERQLAHAAEQLLGRVRGALDGAPQ